MRRDRNAGRSMRRVLFLLLTVALVAAALGAFRIGPAPSIEIKPALPGIGKRTAIEITVAEPRRGLADVRVEFVQGERVELLAEETHRPLAGWQFWGPRTPDRVLTVEIGSETLKGLVEGPATVRVVAQRAPAWLRRPEPVTREVELPVRLRPPVLQVLSSQTYVTQGGAETVVYRIGESAVSDGVHAGERWFPGYPLPGGDGRQRFALFSAPYDLTNPAMIRLVARDDVGNESRVAFVDRFTPRPLRRDTIELPESFLERVVPAVLSETPGFEDRGSLLDNYIAINGELRRQNAATLDELARNSATEFLWREPFLAMRNAAVTSSFADRRTYVYQGRSVDQQDHLGFDLASTRMAPIQSANVGVVVLARYFGIYGNAVVVDHGLGLMSLYGHLSSIGVQEGQRVERGAELGRSGDTGLAGGDHLHFTILLHGLPVDPREWWDDHWIHDRLKLKLGPVLPFAG